VLLLLLLLAQVDCYALGCLLLECVTGERPWKGCNMVQVAYQVGGRTRNAGTLMHALVVLCFSDEQLQLWHWHTLELCPALQVSQ
jgi:hypothetical protein